MTKDEIISGLQEGRKLRCDRKDDPLLPWLLGHPNVENRFVEVDDQYSYVEFWWSEVTNG